MSASYSSVPKHFTALFSIDDDSKEFDYFRLRNPKSSCVNEEIPVTLVSKAFGTFQHELHNNNKDAFTMNKSFNLALKLSMAVSTMSYSAEGVMVSAIKDILRDVFTEYDVVTRGSTHEGYVTDITLCGNGKALCNIEIKLHLGGNSSDANFENMLPSLWTFGHKQGVSCIDCRIRVPTSVWGSKAKARQDNHCTYLQSCFTSVLVTPD